MNEKENLSRELTLKALKRILDDEIGDIRDFISIFRILD